MFYGVVYRIRCLANGKCYHGQTVNPQERWPHHLRRDSHCHALRSAIAKYGQDQFVFEIVAEASSKEELNALEIKWVATSMSPVGYNLKEGGANGTPSAETRNRLSVSNREAQNRPEVKAKNSASVKRAMARPDVKARHRAAVKEAQNRPGVRERKRATMLEVHARPGEKAKRSEAIRASWAGYSEEARAERILRQKAAYTEDFRRHLSERFVEILAKPEVKAKHKAGIKASMTPERLAAHSVRMKELFSRPGVREARGTVIAEVLRKPEVKAKQRAAITEALSRPDVRRRLVRRRRKNETEVAWAARLDRMDREDSEDSGV
ncbi:MAG: GIY-YIG nuclease family protein [Parcubacteria group bacterium]